MSVSDLLSIHGTFLVNVSLPEGLPLREGRGVGFATWTISPDGERVHSVVITPIAGSHLCSYCSAFRVDGAKCVEDFASGSGVGEP